MAVTVSIRERKVLTVLADGSDPHKWRAYSFAGIARRCDVEPHNIRRVTRALARKGLAHHERSLWTDNGMPAGAGYRCTQAGFDWLAAHWALQPQPAATCAAAHPSSLAVST